MRIAILQHDEAMGAAGLQHWLADHQATRYPLYREAILPALEDFDLLLILGGPQSVHDELRCPWMSAEKRLIHQALLGRKRVFGVGLGAQLLAEALGARISSCPDGSRIGWWQLEKYPQAARSPLGRMLPQRLLALHWQRERFSLPHGAIALYGSPAGEQQGFVWQERAIGLQCHLESDAQSLDAWLEQWGAELGTGAAQDHASIRDGAPHSASAKATLLRVLDYLSGGHAHMT